MKPELERAVNTLNSSGAYVGPSDIEAALLALLHWRKHEFCNADEFFCGPFLLGAVNLHFRNSKIDRDALEAAAQEQIRKWFEEQLT